MADRLEAGERSLSRREFLRTGALAGVGALAFGILSFNDPHKFDVSHEQANVRGLRTALRISFLTDLHLGPYLDATDLAAWIAASNAAEPDLVLLGGDLVDQRYRGDLRELRRLLPDLESQLGAYAVLGNHDRTRYRDLEPFADALQASAVELLINSGARLRDDLFLAGIDDLRVGTANVRAALASAPRAEAAKPEDEAGATLLLSHNPDVIPEIGPREGPPLVDLLLAGHTHGGQIRIPGLGPLVTSSAYGARYASGWVPAPFPAFVSRGLGVTALPFRFACPAELVILDLLPVTAT